MTGHHTGETIVARSLDETDGGDENKERSGQLHYGELVVYDDRASVGRSVWWKERKKQKDTRCCERT